MKLSIQSAIICGMTVLITAGLFIGCGGGSKGSDAKPAKAAAPAPKTVASIHAEPRTATVITKGAFHTTLELREGSKVEKLGYQGVNFKPEIPGQGSAGLTIHSGQEVLRHYYAPETPGVYSIKAACGKDYSITKHIEVKVVHAPEGLPVVLEQREVTLSAGATATLSAQTITPAAEGTTRTFLLAVEEKDGGSIENKCVYKAPASPGTYHVRLTSPEDPAVNDRIEMTVVAAES